MKSMKIISNILRAVYILSIYVFVSCGGSSKNSDFNTDKSGLRYKFIQKGQSNEVIAPGDYVEMEIVYKNQNDSILFNSKELRTPFRMQMNKISHKGGCFEDAILLSHPGDKITFVLPADSFYYRTRQMHLPEGVEKGSELIFEMKIIRKMTLEEIQKDRAQYLQKLKDQEDLLINNYLADNEIKVKPNASGLYYIIKKNGNGRKAKSGNILTVHYIGKLVDGTVFDSSYKRNEPFNFKLGDKQVIASWEEACSMMKEGDKVTLIVPSKLAYGAEGFGNLIPPYSPLIFDLELIAIK
jgi:FKBP-type peptidyl-prolyl cis-trans isomerase FkpA